MQYIVYYNTNNINWHCKINVSFEELSGVKCLYIVIWINFVLTIIPISVYLTKARACWGQKNENSGEIPSSTNCLHILTSHNFTNLCNVILESTNLCNSKDVILGRIIIVISIMCWVWFFTHYTKREQCQNNRSMHNRVAKNSPRVQREVTMNIKTFLCSSIWVLSLV